MTVPARVVDRATVATMLKQFAETAMVDTLALVIAAVRRESDEKIATLQARIAELEGRGFTEYRGVFAEGCAYKKGSLVTDHGAMWLALADTNQRPPGADWKMTVRAPRVPTAGTRRQHDQHHRG